MKNEKDIFVQMFTSFWANPNLDDFENLLHQDVVLVQPLTKNTVGIIEAKKETEKGFRFMSDIQGFVDRWSFDKEHIFIDWRIQAKIGGTSIECPIIDRILLKDGKVIERIAYFDSLPIVLHILKNPIALYDLWKSGVSIKL